jgi:hypothetical protein
MTPADLFQSIDFHDQPVTGISYDPAAGALALAMEVNMAPPFDREAEDNFVPGTLQFDDVVDFSAEPPLETMIWADSGVEFLDIQRAAQRDADGRETCRLFLYRTSYADGSRTTIELRFRARAATWTPTEAG